MKYLKLIISGSKLASSRRFIAILTLPLFLIGIGAGIFVGVATGEFRFYLTAIIASAAPIMLAFFSLTWEHVKGILNTNLFKKNSNGMFEPITEDQLKDP